MGEVIAFGRPEKEEPTACGEAFCIACGHEFVAVVPVGLEEFECPQCRTHKARYRFSFRPPAGSLVRKCCCDNDLFYLTPEGHLCANCGTYQEY